MLTQKSTRLRFWHQLWGLLPVSNVGKEANSKINVKKSLLINLSIINSPQKYAQSVEKIFTVPVNVNPELIMMEGNPVLGKERMSPKGAHGDTRKPPLFPSWNPHCPCSTSARFIVTNCIIWPLHMPPSSISNSTVIKYFVSITRNN